LRSWNIVGSERFQTAIVGHFGRKLTHPSDAWFIAPR
jgi:hypothetical protein